LCVYCVCSGEGSKAVQRAECSEGQVDKMQGDGELTVLLDL